MMLASFRCLYLSDVLALQKVMMGMQVAYTNSTDGTPLSSLSLHEGLIFQHEKITKNPDFLHLMLIKRFEFYLLKTDIITVICPFNNQKNTLFNVCNKFCETILHLRFFIL